MLTEMNRNATIRKETTDFFFFKSGFIQVLHPRQTEYQKFHPSVSKIVSPIQTCQHCDLTSRYHTDISVEIYQLRLSKTFWRLQKKKSGVKSSSLHAVSIFVSV